MKTRLAKKIVRTTYKFENFDSNYQPYSPNQQLKALKVQTRGCPRSTKECLYRFGIIKKVPLKYRKYKGFIPTEHGFCINEY